MDVHDDVLSLILERVDSHVSLIRAAAVCRRWRRAIADAAFLRRFRSLHAPAVAGYYHHGPPSLGTRKKPAFVPSSPSIVDARHFSLDFLPDRVESASWRVLHSRGSLLLLSYVDPVSPFRFRHIVVCEPLTRRSRQIHPHLDGADYFCWLFLLDGESNEAGGRISMSNFRVLCVYDHNGVIHAAMYTVDSSWTKKNIDPTFMPSFSKGRSGGCWYFVHDRALITLDGSTGDFSSSELPPFLDWDTHGEGFFITEGGDGNLRIFTVFYDTMKIFMRLQSGEWALEKRVRLSEATRDLPGYKTSFFSGPHIVLTIGAGFVVLSPRIEKLWPFSINLETMEAAPAAKDMGWIVYGCEFPWPPTLHACLDR